MNMAFITWRLALALTLATVNMLSAAQTNSSLPLNETHSSADLLLPLLEPYNQTSSSSLNANSSNTSSSSSTSLLNELSFAKKGLLLVNNTHRNDQPPEDDTDDEAGLTKQRMSSAQVGRLSLPAILTVIVVLIVALVAVISSALLIMRKRFSVWRSSDAAKKSSSESLGSGNPNEKLNPGGDEASAQVIQGLDAKVEQQQFFNLSDANNLTSVENKQSTIAAVATISRQHPEEEEHDSGLSNQRLIGPKDDEEASIAAVKVSVRFRVRVKVRVSVRVGLGLGLGLGSGLGSGLGLGLGLG